MLTAVIVLGGRLLFDGHERLDGQKDRRGVAVGRAGRGDRTDFGRPRCVRRSSLPSLTDLKNLLAAAMAKKNENDEIHFQSQFLAWALRILFINF